MMVPSKFSWLLPLGVLATSALCSCLDFTPITVAPTEAGTDDAPIPSIVTDFDGGACEPCVEGPSCSAALATCDATPKCSAMFQCGLARGCYAQGANLVACLTVCGQQAGLSGQTDPAVGPFLGLYECATSKCSAACGN
jgi:hypothetical protein